MELELTTRREREAIDVTDRVASLAHPDGFAWIACPHTTCALILCEADTDMLADIEKAAGQLLAPIGPFAHHRNNNPNAAAHLWSALAGTQLLIPVRDGEMQLGSYQRIVFVELDGPRERRTILIAYLPVLETNVAAAPSATTS
jgi:secondary thiamine-phosphate synthase enzyme